MLQLVWVIALFDHEERREVGYVLRFYECMGCLGILVHVYCGGQL